MAVKVFLAVLGLQVYLLCLTHGAENRSHEELQRAELDPKSVMPAGTYQAVDPLLGLRQKFQEPDIMLVKRSLRTRRRAEKKKKRKGNAGAFSTLSKPAETQMSSNRKKTPGARSKRNEGLNIRAAKRRNSRTHQGNMSPIGETGVPEVFRARRQLDKNRKRPKKWPGTYSALSYVSTKDKERSMMKEEQRKDDSDD